MPTWVWWIVGFLVVALLAALLARRTTLGTVDATELTFDPSTMAHIRRLAGTDKIAAIKALRAAAPGLGLAQAKLMVEKMAAPAGPSTPPAAEHVPSPGLDLDLELQVHQLAQAGQSIQAIKMLRAATGWSLEQAKDYVDRV